MPDPINALRAVVMRDEANDIVDNEMKSLVAKISPEKTGDA